jgi:D-glycero-D-manno-heptose 1,7-bisphosphate phosphatase
MVNVPKRALFLDRDGVVNVEKDYLYKVEDFEFIDGIFELCKHYVDLGYLIIIVTNQSGICRDFYSEKDFDFLTDWMLGEFNSHDINISRVYHCPHHPDISGHCSCRKPEPGMILDAKREFDLDLSRSLIIGDKERDIEAGINAGIIETYLFDEKNETQSSKATKIVSKLNDVWKK